MEYGGLQRASSGLVDWTISDVIDFLETCRSKFGGKIEQYKQIFIENDVDGEVLADMSDDQLQRLGIASFGHRMFILKKIQMMKPGASVQVAGSTTGMTPSANQFVAPTNVPMMGMGMGVGAGAMPPPQRPNDLAAFKGFNMPDDAGGKVLTRAAVPRLHQPTPRIHESKVTVGRKIGSGSVGHVYAGTYESHPVAIKKHKMDGSMMDQKALQEFEIEVGKMTAVNHPCIVRCYGMLEPTPGIVLELVEGGSLFQIIHQDRDEPFAAYVPSQRFMRCRKNVVAERDGW
eukprot:CAMPEP_0113711710 /NCGR_PEP_ID=MMETSP0038_2-20120614/30931_1 /TAXON_ID=2898 /ORGANISM="Cryptomonas paramecium" /LENGTH=287 /DNA_ID=CAMNT_0000638043 /DNA_START=155 /DNA_END=1015 /DNA_ORIENTATION=+ /assembly_acc=CAM_ASM_000170